MAMPLFSLELSTNQRNNNRRKIRITRKENVG